MAKSNSPLKERTPTILHKRSVGALRALLEMTPNFKPNLEKKTDLDFGRQKLKNYPDMSYFTATHAVTKASKMVLNSVPFDSSVNFIKRIYETLVRPGND
jgi:hypothetical protein